MVLAVGLSLLLAAVVAREAWPSRKRDVLGLMAEGLSNSAIAGRLGLSERSVEAVCGQVFGKLGLEPSPEVNRRVLAVLTLVRT